MPADDGTPRDWCSLVAAADGGIEIRLMPLDYDPRSAAAKIRSRGLPDGYAALETGLWPSSDVLPGAELGRRGRALRPDSLRWNAVSRSRRSSA